MKNNKYTQLLEKLQLKNLDYSMKFLSRYQKEVQEIELLQGKQRAVRVQELKAMFFDEILETSAIYRAVPKEYKGLFKSEFISILTME